MSSQALKKELATIIRKSGVMDLSVHANEFIKDDPNKRYCKDCGKLKTVIRYNEFVSNFIRTSPKDEDLEPICTCDRDTRIKEQREEHNQKNLRYYKDNFDKYVPHPTVSFSDTFYKEHFNTEQSLLLKRVESIADEIIAEHEEFDKVIKKNQSMYIYSITAGNGKSSILSCLRNKLISNGVPTIMLNHSDLESVYNDWHFERKLEEVAVLIIDDLAITKCDYKTQAVLYEITDYRQSRNMTTFFSSNKSIKELESTGIQYQTVDRINGLVHRFEYKLQTQISLRGN